VFPSVAFFAYLLGLLTSFYSANWEEHHTGVLRCSMFGLGLTECQWFLILVMLTQGFSGGAFSQLTVRSLGTRLLPGVSQSQVESVLQPLLAALSVVNPAD
jgi:hypothetical protein